MDEIRTLAKVSLLILLYYAIYALYSGVMNPVPALGDSWDYHIPISKTILNGSFLNPTDFKLPQWYYPGSAEAINAVFLLVNIPLTISNLFAAIVLFFTCWKLGMTFKLHYYYALLFAVTICSLNVVVRWFNAVSIDIWVAVFFCWTIILLEAPKKTLKYFFQLGFILGMLIGSKYTAILFAIILLSLYSKVLLKIINVHRIIAFLIPFSIVGLFWYIRNYISIGNPFYPLDVLGFQGVNLFTSKVIFVIFEYPLQMFNAVFGEYKLWSFVLLLPPLFYGLQFFKKKRIEIYGLQTLLLIGSLGSILFLFFPTSGEEWIMVSSLRYSYPIFIPLILSGFLLTQKYNYQNILGYFVIANMITVISFAYYPKLILFYLPLAFGSVYLLRKYEHKFK